MVARLTGTSVTRVEDPRILTGGGTYVDDLRLPGMLHAAFVRSPFPHARVLGVDVTAALTVPGVRAVITAAELAGVVADLAPVGPPDLLLPSFPALARDTVRLVGDPVALVLADSRAEAEDGAEAGGGRLRAAPAGRRRHGRRPGRTRPLPLFAELGHQRGPPLAHRYGDTDAAFAAADRVVAGPVRAAPPCQRPDGVPRRRRRPRPGDRPRSTYTATHQSPHALRLHLADVLGSRAHAGAGALRRHRGLVRPEERARPARTWPSPRRRCCWAGR